MTQSMPAYACTRCDSITLNSDHCARCGPAFPFAVRTATPDEGAVFEQSFAKIKDRQITYLDDGIEIRVTVPLKPGALKFARGFLEQLLRDTGNG